MDVNQTGSGPGMTGSGTGARIRAGAVAPFLLLSGILALELLAISLLYNHSFEFECRAMAPMVFCAALGFGVIRAIAVLGAVTVFLFAKGRAIADLMARMRPRLHPGWLGAELAGFAAILIPWSFMSDAASGGALALAAGFWLGGLLLAGAGSILSLFPLDAVIRAIRQAGWPLLAVIAVAGFAPEIADLAQFLWHWPAMAAFTFASVAFALGALGQEVHAIPAEVELGVGDFIVLVGRQCSGVEGFALITSFLLLYIWLFRDILRFPKVWILIPIGIAVSWCFNVIRISALILVGAYISPDLAINGFHSHAGWLMFTTLSVGMAGLVHRTNWFRRDGAARRVDADRVPLFQDLAAAKILPFLVFMASALLAQTFSEIPALLYPARALAMAAVLWMFRGLLARLPWRFDPVAAVAGLALGGLWLATSEAAPDPGLTAALAGMSGPVFLVWVLSRVIGTTLFVPVIEELFFRGYVMGLFSGPSQGSSQGGSWGRSWGGESWGRVALAVLVSAGLFGLLHGRWVMGGLAGIIFGLLVLRQRQAISRDGTGPEHLAVTDAMLAHMLANGLIALAAFFGGNWALI